MKRVVSLISKLAAGLVQDIEGKLHRHFGRSMQNASREQVFRACALCLRDRMSSWLLEAQENGGGTVDDREVHYLSLEFLLGRSLEKNAFNLGLLDALREALAELGVDPEGLFETEPDPGLGNGGLGRLAACYLDAMTTQGIPVTGYSLCYEHGIFRQKILEGQQVELPDLWMGIGDVWLIPHLEEAEEVRFGGKVEERWTEDGRHVAHHTDFQTVLAIPMDMLISGYQTYHVNRLRLWDSKSPTALDMDAFSRGEYMKALEQNAMAEVITKILYPDDHHFEGKLLRLRQQYFFVSATVQSILRAHKKKYGRVDNFHLKNVIHINDTHPALVIPELMRILTDEEGLAWDQAWSIVTRTVVYTNHTVMSEALECWPQNIVEMLLPRIWGILCEINDRYIGLLRAYMMDEYRVSRLAVIWDGQVRMANLCVYACCAVNGVSEQHSGILRTSLFQEVYRMWPQKFFNVTNGIDHRRWLAQINPPLAGLVSEILGSYDYLKRPQELAGLAAYAGDNAVLTRLAEIKAANKARFSDWIGRTQGASVDPESLFDVQAKRLHEYKRQLLNVMHILHLYRRLREDASFDMEPRTFLFGAKAASGYYMAKRIIRLINSLAADINAEPVARGKLKVVFVEDFGVMLAEHLMPAAEISEQISVAGREASGTGNMKFMLNGALTVGTMDGANVEIHGAVGDDNIFIFGLRADEVRDRLVDGTYSPSYYYQHDEELRAVLDMISAGFSDGISYQDITQSLLIGAGGQADPYMLLADFRSYVDIQEKAAAVYRDKRRWNRMSLMNIAGAGRFAADRAVAQYAEAIWNIR